MTASPAGAPLTGPAFSTLPLADHVLANLQRLGYEYMLLVLAATVTLVLAGGSALAVDRRGR